jgi:hypothetical protein
LRKSSGIHLDALEREFDIDFRKKYAPVLKKYLGKYLELQGGWLTLKESKIPVSNAILADFLTGF